MAQNSINFAFFTYIDDDAVSWNKRGESGGAATAVDGHAAPGALDVWEDRGTRQKARKITYVDDTDVTGGRTPTGRTYSPIFYTAAAFAAVAKGDIVAVPVPGAATSINYYARIKKAEKKAASTLLGHHLPL
jgi:hypothetical protein